MFCCDLSPQVIPSPEGERLSQWLKKIAIGHLVVALLYFIGATYLIMGLTDLIFAWFVFIAYRTFSYCYLTIYIWFLMFNIITNFITIGGFIQFSSNFNSMGWKYPYMLGVFIISLGFYFFAMYISYKAYKEFKALAIAVFADGEGNQECMICIK